MDAKKGLMGDITADYIASALAKEMFDYNPYQGRNGGNRETTINMTP